MYTLTVKRASGAESKQDYDNLKLAMSALWYAWDHPLTHSAVLRAQNGYGCDNVPVMAVRGAQYA